MSAKTTIKPFQGGVPTGGTIDQVLKKLSATDYDFAWDTFSGVGDGDKGDITVSLSGSVWTIDPEVVTFAKMQNVNQFELLGRYSTGSGPIQALTLGNNLELFSDGSLNISNNKFFDIITDRDKIVDAFGFQARGSFSSDAYSEMYVGGNPSIGAGYHTLYGWFGEETYLKGCMIEAGKSNSGIDADGFFKIQSTNNYNILYMGKDDTNHVIDLAVYQNFVRIQTNGIVFGYDTNLVGAIPTSGTRFDFVSTQGGLKFPLHTTTQRNTLANVAANTLWNSTDSRLQINNGTTWNDVAYLSDVPKITVSTTAPTSPAVNDLWVDTN